MFFLGEGGFASLHAREIIWACYSRVLGKFLEEGIAGFLNVSAVLFFSGNVLERMVIVRFRSFF